MMDSPRGRSRFFQSSSFGYLILVAAVALVYGHTLNVPWYFDDYNNIVNNPAIRTIDITQVGNARGLVNLSFALNYLVHGLNLPGYHLVNIILHTLTVLLVFQVSRRIFRDSWWWPLCVALVFALHPLQTQAVTYVVQRMAVMAGMFYFLALYLYVLFLEQRNGPARWPLLCCAWLSGGLAVLCKENAATLPAVIFLIESVYLNRESESLRKRLVRLLPFALVPLWVALGKIGLPVFGGSTLQHIGNFETVSAAEKVSPLQYFATEMPIIWRYFRLLILPWGQALDYGHPFAESFANFKTISSFLGLTGLVGLALKFRQRAPWFLFGLTWVLVTLSVESTIIPLDPIYEHRLYIPMFGFAVCVAHFLREGIPWLTRYGRHASIAYLIILAVLTFSRNAVWGDPVAFWESNARQVVSGYRVHMQLADAYYAKGMNDKANNAYREAIAEAERIGVGRLGAKYLLNLCVAAERIGFYDKATNYCGLAVYRVPRSPMAHYNLGVALYRSGDLDAAGQSFDRARGLRPGMAEAHYNYASVSLEMGDISPAREVIPLLMRLDKTLAGRLASEMEEFSQGNK